MGYSMGGIWGTMYILFVSLIVVALALIVTRFIGSKYMKTMSGKNITIVESTSLGLDKSLYLVNIGEQYFLISSGGKTITMLSEIDKSNIVNQDKSIIANNIFPEMNSFSKYVNMFKEKFPKETKEIKKDNLTVTMPNREDTKNIDKNVEKIRDIFNNIKVSDKDGVE